MDLFHLLHQILEELDCFEILRAVICYGLYVAVIFWAEKF